MSSVKKILPKISRHQEAMYVRFADLPYEVSLEVASNFVVDFSPDDDIVGLEILWEDTDRDGSEPALLAFGMFASAIVWRGYHHKGYNGHKMRWAVLRKVKEFISAADLPMQAGYSGNSGLTIRDGYGKLLLHADLQFYPQHMLKSKNYQYHKSSAVLLDAEIEKIRSAIGNLAETILPDNPGAVGVAVFVDEIGLLSHCEPLAPGKWVTWPEAAEYVRTHIAVIPPQDCTYPWLTDGFASTQT